MPVYVNRLFNFKKIKLVGFDMDYTLVPYNIAAFEGLAHFLALERLKKDYNYPEEITRLAFDRERAIVGLVIDKRNGNLLKLSRFGEVKLAYNGLDEIDFRELATLYRERMIDLQDSDFQSLDTAFAISCGVLFAQLVQMKKEGMNLPDHRILASDVNECIDSLHKDGSIKTHLMADFDRYVIRDPQTAVMLERLKTEKKLMLITNSDYAYTKSLLEYALDPFWKEHQGWQEVFDLIITFAEKPRFFERPNHFLRIDPETGLMSNAREPISEGIWQGGWFGAIQEGMKIPGDQILYLGDHIYGDVVSIKKACDWRTGLVLGGLEDEIAAIRRTRKMQGEIDAMMKRKTVLERENDRADLLKREGKPVSLPKEHIEEQNRLNLQISKLLDERKIHFNPYWGEILRAGSEESRYAEQVEKYACIYMIRVSDLFEFSPRSYFRPARRLLAHEIVEESDAS